MTAAKPPAPTTSAEVRDQLIEALRLDLIGPRPGHPPHADFAEERLPVAPSIYYLTGFLTPSEAPAEDRCDPEGADILDSAPHPVGSEDNPAPEQAARRKVFFPSSFGLSVLVDGDTQELQATLRWADYHRLAPTQDLPEGEPPPVPEPGVRTEQRAGRGRWQREAREAQVTLPLQAGEVALPGARDLKLVVSPRELQGELGLAPGSRAVSVFLVNHRRPAPDAHRDSAYVFQPELSLSCEAGFLPRPDLRGGEPQDWDEQVADLQYADALEFAVGHNVAALADPEGEACHRVRTAWMPQADVEKVIPRQLPEAELRMEKLGAFREAQQMQDALQPMIDAYSGWIAEQGAKATWLRKPQRKTTAQTLRKRAEHARDRLQAGLQTLSDDKVRKAFRFANLAMARAYRQRRIHNTELRPNDIQAPRWRPFQLAFLLMNLPGAADPDHPDREVVDLLFFPTGGGKTEAYLGLAAFSMFLRRLRDPAAAGVSVLMRYTLRLLTLDQLERATTLVCAMELARSRYPEQLGAWPFEIGLWVGQAATPNRMGGRGDKSKETARARTLDYHRDSKHKPPPLPLQRCPWCGWSLGKESFQLLPNSDAPTRLQVSCRQKKCDFSLENRPGGLPLLGVDEMIYRRLPAFIIATVDKFANLPWVGDSGALFGRVQRFDKHGFYGPTEPARGQRLPDGRAQLPPPDLIIQDELHLISGPLGTMVGLYETAIDALCRPQLDTDAPGPKIVASTATVRRAERQIRGLFARGAVEVFPPPGPDREDSFFALTTPPSDKNPRRYLGVAAPGRNLKVVYLRTALSLMAAAQRAYLQAGGAKADPNPADPYMSLVSYFNSLRELGGSRRILEDEVQSRLHDYTARRAREGVARQLFSNRKQLKEPAELTSRVSTAEVAQTKQRLALRHADKSRIDVALATNMISVGLDIDRLGLMLVLGQPKTAAEYIQATSRVGRDDQRPGLVVTLLNPARPRDRSHWERFTAWHRSFYRAVEATSVTPFSPRAVDRGLVGITVAMARLGYLGLTPAKAASMLAQQRDQVDQVADLIADRAAAHDAQLDQPQQDALRTTLKARVLRLLDDWQAVTKDKGERVEYSKEAGWTPLLYTPLDPELAKQPKLARQFTAGRSLRDVEPVVKLWLRDLDGDLIDAGGDQDPAP